MSEDTATFRSNFGLVISCLGCVIGIGNIWRFPRIAALNSTSEGGLSFLIAWIILLLLWSMPMMLAETAMGRYCRGGPIRAFRTFVGDSCTWCGLWVMCVTLLIMCYNIVIQGWCLYYVYFTIAAKELPKTVEEGNREFNKFVEGWWWPVLTQGIGLLIATGFTVGGTRWIKRANMFFIPALFVILLFAFGWSLSQHKSDYGIKYFFSPNWASLMKPSLWMNAMTQNAFDTSAGLAILLTYSSYMSVSDPIVKLSVFIPIGNNLLSLMCGITIFAFAFISVIESDPTMTQAGIVEMLKSSGPGNTGLIFVWIPILFEKAGIFGRIVCVLFFLCLSFVGISCTVATFEMATVSLKEIGVPNRKITTAIIIVILFGIGFGSAYSPTFLNNQDTVWTFALLFSGMMMQLTIVYYGILRFIQSAINDFGVKDWKAPFVWAVVMQFVAPWAALGLLIWWIYDVISSNLTSWYHFTETSLLTVILQWIVLITTVLLVNFFLCRLHPNWNREEHLPEEYTTDDLPMAEDAGATECHDNKVYMSYDNEEFVDRPVPHAHPTPRPLPRMSLHETESRTAF